MYRNSGISAILLAGMLIAPAHAQEDVTIDRTLTVTVAPGMNDQFEEFVAAFRHASREQALDNYWRSSQSLSGDSVYKFHTVLSSWGDVATPGPQLAEVYGDDEATRLLGLLHDSVESVRTAFYEEPADMSRQPPAMDKPPEGLVYLHFTLNPNTEAQWAEVARSQAEASADVAPKSYFIAGMPSYGTNKARTIVILPSFEDLDTPMSGPVERIMKHFGEKEGARINEVANQALVSTESDLFRTRPDLDYQPSEE